MIKKILALSFFLIQISLSYSQKQEDYDLFVNEAKELSNLYRGAAPLRYNFLFTGTYFAYSEEYIQGDVFYNDKQYKDVLLNLNSHIDELYVLVKESGLPVMLNKDFVKQFNIGDRHFKNLTFKKNNLSLEDGYYEVLWNKDRDWLLKKTIKKYEERINIMAYAQASNKVERVFHNTIQYYLIRDNFAKKIKRASDLRSSYGVSAGELRRYIKEANIEVRHNEDFAFTRILEFINSSLLKDSK